MDLLIRVAQINYCVGDISGNSAKIVKVAREAYAAGVDVLLTSELSLCGYAAEDLFLRPAFIATCEQAVNDLARELSDLAGMCVVVGHPSGEKTLRSKSISLRRLHNSASVLRDGKIEHTYHKRELPNYQVFDEHRYFVAGGEACVFHAGRGENKIRLGLLICEDAWHPAPALETKAKGADILAVLNASPFHLGKEQERFDAMRERAKECGLPVVYSHMVGGQDEIVFEGRSFALQSDGSLAARAPAFSEAVMDVEAHSTGKDSVVNLDGKIEDLLSPLEDLWHALVLGVRDYVQKNGFHGVVLGLSGGVDSALVLAIAVDALGANRVRTVMMPSPYTADISWIDARELAGNLGVQYDEIAIEPVFNQFSCALAPVFAGRQNDTTEENIQARIRGTMLMALSNKFGLLLLTTGNKSEMATGYCTLYGDMAGGFAVIKDLTKTRVYDLVKWRNSHDRYHTGSNPIPLRIITRPPSAELRPDQTDQDSLPPYDVLDAIIERYMEDDASVAELLLEGFSEADVKKVTHLIKINEHKRRQAPSGVRLTHRSFGKDWRYPITNRFFG